MPRNDIGYRALYTKILSGRLVLMRIDPDIGLLPTLEEGGEQTNNK